MLSRLERVKAFRDKVNANIIATRKLVRVDELEPSELEDMIDLYEGYQINYDYVVGDVFKYEGKLYKVIQEHTSQEDWLPNELPALYLNLMPDNVIPEWKQPTGGHDAYMLGDRMLFTDGIVYESTRDDNVWSPIELPDAWIAV